jgi:hypothetical protein
MAEAAPNISPAQIAALSPEGRATALAAASKFYDPVATQALFDATPAPAAKIQPDPTGMPGLETEAQLIAKGHSPEWIATEMQHRAANPAPIAPAASTDAEGLARWRHVLDNSSLDRATVIAEAAKSGYDISVPGIDPAVARAAAIDAAVQEQVSPPQDAGSYHIEWSNAHDDSIDLAGQNREYTTAFHATGVPQDHANALANSMLAAQRAYQSQLDPNVVHGLEDIERDNGARKLKALEEGAIVKKLSGDVVRLGTLALAAMAKAFRTEMESKFSFNTAQVWACLAGVGAAIEMKKGKTKR